MTDRKVTITEADARRLLSGERLSAAGVRLQAVLDALDPEPCGHPSKYEAAVHMFRCVLPKGHHAWDSEYCSRCDLDLGDSIHCGDEHMPPADVWAKGHHVYAQNGAGHCDLCGGHTDDPIHCGDAHVPPADVWSTDV